LEQVDIAQLALGT